MAGYHRRPEGQVRFLMKSDLNYFVFMTSNLVGEKKFCQDNLFTGFVRRALCSFVEEIHILFTRHLQYQ